MLLISNDGQFNFDGILDLISDRSLLSLMERDRETFSKKFDYAFFYLNNVYKFYHYMTYHGNYSLMANGFGMAHNHRLDLPVKEKCKELYLRALEKFKCELKLFIDSYELYLFKTLEHQMGIFILKEDKFLAQYYNESLRLNLMSKLF